MSVEELGFKDFEKVLETISRVDSWDWDADFSQGSIRTTAQKAESMEAEGRFSHIDTEGVLYVRLPDLSEKQGCMTALLEQPFDLQNPQESTFLQEVGNATGKLVPADSDYVTPEYTAISVLKISIPVRYNLSKVEAAAYTASSVSEDVSELYRGIRDSVE